MKQSVDFMVQGMQSKACADKLQVALAGLPGVQEVFVSLEKGRAHINFETNELHINQLDSAIHAVGFKTAPGCL